MMDRQERSALTAALCNVVRDYVAKAEDKLSKWVNGELRALTDLIDERFRSLPLPIQGERGEKGDKGDPGERGEVGPAGFPIQGERGEKGDPGEKGDKGDRGEPGESIKGDKGDQGERGERGESGPTGLTGEKGIDGKDGRDGIDGKDGAPGIQGIPGERGERGEKGIDGKDGRDAKDGRDGRDGLPGRDALELEIVEAEEGKSYPRGTFATHKGGLVRFAGTNIVQVIVRGIDTLDIVQGEDLRSFTVRISLTDGYMVEKEFSMPAVIYRGVFQSGTRYERGDCVTYSNSSWHCNAKFTTATPDAAKSKDWQMMARAGRDGKDLRPEEPKPAHVLSLK